MEKKQESRRTGTTMCSPDAWSVTMVWLHYYLARASAALRGGTYDECYVIPSLTGWDPTRARWRRPMVFGGPTHAHASCDGLERGRMPRMLAMPDVAALEAVCA